MNQTALTLDRYLGLLQDDTEELARVLDNTDFATPVPSCPGWTLADLAFHVGDVHRFFRWVVQERVEVVNDANKPQVAPPADAALAQWLRDGVADLLRVLRAADPRWAAWSWTPQRDVAFVQRRMPHETSVHRWDAQHAADGGGAPIASDLAADGISEFFFLASTDRYEQQARIALRAVDTGQLWTAWVQDGQMNWLEGRADAEILLVGSASDLLLTLWRRIHPYGGPAVGGGGQGEGGVIVEGDAHAAQHFLRLVDLD